MPHCSIIRSSLVLAALAALVPLLVACGRPAPKAAPAPIAKAASAPAAPASESSGVEGEIGGLNEEAVEGAFTSLGVPECLMQGSQRLREIGGSFKLKVRIDRKGAARWAYLSQSTLGDRETEKCVLERARAKAWPKPVGGEGIAEKAFEMDPRATPTPLGEKDLGQELDRARAATASCRRASPGTFFATVYLRYSGQVFAAGVSPPNEKGEEAADCVVEALRKAKFHPTGRKAAKVSFEIR